MKAEVDKLDINRLVNVPSGLNKLEPKVDDLDVGELKAVPIELSGYILGIKFDKDALDVKQNNYITKILDVLPRNLTDSFKFQIFLFCTTNIIKNNDKEKWVYSGYGIYLMEQAHGILIMTLPGML